MPNKRVFIIAEAGVNHNGSLETARKMIEAAAGAGADAVKFQTFRAENIVSAYAPKAEYQMKTTGKEGSQLEMIKNLELDENAHRNLINYCNKKDIMFLSTPFDLASIDMLDKLGLDIYKIPSGEITDLPYLRKVGGLGKRIIMSTGMSCLNEVGDALSVLEGAGTPRERVTVLHCNTEYPTPVEDVNLTAMLTIRDTFGVRVGYSDHTLGIEVPIAAVAIGATLIEKHFTLIRDMAGPDQRASLEPEELKKMVKAIRMTEMVLGDGVKKPSPSEEKNRPIVCKSIVAAKSIQKGEFFTEENITVKRPGSGISPMEWDRVIGKEAIRYFKEDELIEV